MRKNSEGAKTRQQIANEYGICPKTLMKWLRQENIILEKGLIRPKMQQKLYEILGSPKNSK